MVMHGLNREINIEIASVCRTDVVTRSRCDSSATPLSDLACLYHLPEESVKAVVVARELSLPVHCLSSAVLNVAVKGKGLFIAVSKTSKGQVVLEKTTAPSLVLNQK